MKAEQKKVKMSGTTYSQVKQLEGEVEPQNFDPDDVTTSTYTPNTYNEKKLLQDPPQNVIVTLPTRVPNYIGLAIFSTFCCCLPMGAFAIRRNQEARRLVASGDLAEAHKKAATSRRLSIWSMVVGFIFWGVVIGLGVGLSLDHKHIAYKGYG